MKVIVLGGDGFCGWPTSLKLAKEGHEVTIVDNLSRRAIDLELSSGSLTNIASIRDRIKVANEKIGKIDFHNIDIAKDFAGLRNLIADVKPDSIIQFAEQRAAPYSMIGDSERRYTVDNNIVGTHNVCSAIVEVDPSIHLIHLGTMGVYGYSKEFGKIPEGYLDIEIKSTAQDTQILYPANPGSVYHMTKCLDQLIFQFYHKNWGLKVTDLHQGIVWGVETAETKLDPALVNRFDYDGVYGTVLNRFISQAANDVPLTVYGIGGQERAFIHISDSARCLQLAVENPPADGERVRIFNQVSEVQSVKGLAQILADQTGAEVQFVDNPRKELAENELEVANDGLRSLGFEPVLLNTDLIEDVKFIGNETKHNFDKANVLSSPKW
ncbi:NAD-dependent dehydratase [Amylibacter kogurei]|uniref:NAD-dependent dehydratase n=1 Tax=Paramylibacter kogurei TaxID=1889778 RepID=A0A2G5KAN9_9RHOB|nr:NAD-dependent epimerase/dehydratase family protein [Amylibacter kogurei]PIB26598.1 NAD-dependent dehydratase [Amylibacter kogurei]